ncbi:MAG: DUF1573 domain-containing protein [Anaerolineae bacterium]
MSRKRKKRTAQAASSNRRSRKSSRRHRRSRGVDPLVWVGGTAAIIAALLVFGMWQSGAFAKPPVPSRSEGVANLLPLAEAGRSLRGDHDMALIPQQTPAPQAAPADVPIPRLDMPSVSHDFGHIYEQWDVTHIFAVQNTGSADLEITNLVTSCGCTVAVISSNVIPPGQRADLTVTFDPDFHETQGEVVRLVWFATNDPAQPWVEVRITADVQS